MVLEGDGVVGVGIGFVMYEYCALFNLAKPPYGFLEIRTSGCFCFY